MFELLKKTYLMGLGLASLTREKVEEFVDELVRRGEVAEKDRRKTVEDLMSRAREEQQKLSAAVRDAVNKLLKEKRTPTSEQFEELVRRVETLEKKASGPGKSGS